MRNLLISNHLSFLVFLLNVLVNYGDVDGVSNKALAALP